jgi:hypothetical protein
MRMVSGELDVNEYLAPRDPSSLPRRRGREASTFYPRMVEAFLSANQAAMEVDVAKIGRRPETVRAALVKSIKSLGVQDRARVTFAAGQVLLIRR